MKKEMFLMIAAIIFGWGVFAQEYAPVKQKSPKFLIGGNVAFDFAQAKATNTYYDKHSFADVIDFHFKPYFGYIISSKVTMGVKLGLNYYENAFADPHTIPILTKDDSEYVTYTSPIGIKDGNSFEIATFLRVQDTLVGKFRYYVDFCLGTEFSGNMEAKIVYTNSRDDEPEYKLNYYYASVDVGILFLLSQKTGIEFKLAGIELGKRYEKFDSWFYDYGEITDLDIESINFDFFSDFLQPNLGIVVKF